MELGYESRFLAADTCSSSSGIGRSVAVLYAREGADVSIVYLPEEQEDADEVKKMVEKEGQQCLLIPGDLMDNKFCKEAIDKHIAKYSKIDILVNNAYVFDAVKKITTPTPH